MVKKLVVLGSINIDHLLKVTSFPKPGETLNGKHYQIAFGGKGGNQALAAARSGASTQFIAAIGENDLGQEVIKQFQKEHIDISSIEVITNQQTGALSFSSMMMVKIK